MKPKASQPRSEACDQGSSQGKLYVYRLYICIYIYIYVFAHSGQMFMTSFAYEISKVSREMLSWVLLCCSSLESSNEDGNSGFVSTKQKGC